MVQLIDSLFHQPGQGCSLITVGKGFLSWFFYMLLIVCLGQTFGAFSISIIIFTEGIVKKIIRVVLSLLEEETSKESQPGSDMSVS